MVPRDVGKLAFLVIMALIIVALPAAAAPAVDNVWAGNTDVWGSPGNWSLNSVPTSTSDVVIPSAPAGGNFPVVALPSVSLANLTVESGATLDMDDNDLSVSGVLSNSGTLIRTAMVTDDGTGGKSFAFFDTGGYGGLTLTPGLGADLGLTEVRIKGNASCDSANSTVRRCFDITPAISNPAAVVTAEFNYANSELNGSTCNTIEPYRWDGAAWQVAGTFFSRSCGGDPESVTALGIAQFSRFSLADGTPTAVTLAQLDAAGGPPLAALPVTIGAFLVLIAASWLLHNRQKSSSGDY